MAANELIIQDSDNLRQRYHQENMYAPVGSGGMPPMSMQQTHIVEESDLGRAIAELNDDKTAPDTKMSNIDMRSRLGSLEISGLLAADMLVALQFLPDSLINLTRQKKRLAVSKGGLGRKEIVDIVVGERQQQQKSQGMFPALTKK